MGVRQAILGDFPPVNIRRSLVRLAIALAVLLSSSTTLAANSGLKGTGTYGLAGCGRARRSARSP